MIARRTQRRTRTPWAEGERAAELHRMLEEARRRDATPSRIPAEAPPAGKQPGNGNAP